MPLHFSQDEMTARRQAAQEAMTARGLDGLLMFKQESMYYLTGYDTFGFALFQCLYLGADGEVTLLTRLPDLRQAQQTSDIEDIRIWVDRAGMNPGHDLKDMLESHGCRGKRLGIEMDSYGLTAKSWRLVETALDGFCQLEDASDLVTLLRRIKSPQEIAYHREAAKLADQALEEAVSLTRAGAFEGDILAAMQGAVFRGGGDYAGNEFIIGSGNGALLCRYFTGRRHLEPQDQLTLEFAGAYRRYHAAMMRTLLVGTANDHQKAMYAACLEALAACEAAIKPGQPMGDVFGAYARVMDAHGFRHARLNACGYGMGAVYNPIWVDFPMFYHGNEWLMSESGVFFLHMILMDSEAGQAMSLGHSVLVTADGCEPLSQAPLDLVVK